MAGEKRDRTLEEESAELRRAWLDFAYAVGKPLISLVERIPGLQLKAWVRERQIRERWRR